MHRVHDHKHFAVARTRSIRSLAASAATARAAGAPYVGMQIAQEGGGGVADAYLPRSRAPSTQGVLRACSEEARRRAVLVAWRQGALHARGRRAGPAWPGRLGRGVFPVGIRLRCRWCTRASPSPPRRRRWAAARRRARAARRGGLRGKERRDHSSRSKGSGQVTGRRRARPRAAAAGRRRAPTACSPPARARSPATRGEVLARTPPAPYEEGAGARSPP